MKKTTHEELGIFRQVERTKLQIAVAIDNMLKSQGLTRSQFAKELSVSPSAVSQLLSGDRNITIGYLARILHILDGEIEIISTEAAKKKRLVAAVARERRVSRQSHYASATQWCVAEEIMRSAEDEFETTLGSSLCDKTAVWFRSPDNRSHGYQIVSRKDSRGTE